MRDREKDCTVCGAKFRGLRLTCSDACLSAALSENLHGRRLDHGQQQPWTRERVIAKIQRFAKDRGRPPRFTEWLKPELPPDAPPLSARSQYPNPATVQTLFGSWNEAIRVAGFTPREKGEQAMNGAKCRNKRHPWIPENIYTQANGKSQCRLCLRDSQVRNRKARNARRREARAKEKKR